MQTVEQEVGERAIVVAESGVPLAERPHRAGQPVRLRRIRRIGQLDGDRTGVQRAVGLLPQHDVACVGSVDRLQVGERPQQTARIVTAARAAAGSPVPQEDHGRSCDVVGVVGTLTPVAGGLVTGPAAHPAEAACAVGVGVRPRRPGVRFVVDRECGVRGCPDQRHFVEQEAQVGEVREAGACGDRRHSGCSRPSIRMSGCRARGRRREDGCRAERRGGACRGEESASSGLHDASHPSLRAPPQGWAGSWMATASVVSDWP